MAMKLTRLSKKYFCITGKNFHCSPTAKVTDILNNNIIEGD
jgi:hypothetical protein